MKTKHEPSIKSLKHLKYDLETYTKPMNFFVIKTTRQKTPQNIKREKTRTIAKVWLAKQRTNPKYNSNTSLVFKFYMIKFTNLL
jgi:predicted fused transcriptional regulator/phosphomethylpyrimidine kinase